MPKVKVPNRSWPVSESRGWQQSTEFFRTYPTRQARHDFYQKREALNRAVREGWRNPDGSPRPNLCPDPYHGPRTESMGAW